MIVVIILIMTIMITTTIHCIYMYIYIHVHVQSPPAKQGDPSKSAGNLDEGAWELDLWST